MTEKSTMNSADGTTTVKAAQADLRNGYANGSVGVIVSGIMWLISAFVAYQFSGKHAVWTLLIGGMFIHPVSMLLSKAVGVKGGHSKGNPLANLAMEGTIFMLMCLPLAFVLSLHQTEWFFPAMLLIIGGRYLTFATLYGTRLYWIMGAVLGIAAYLLFSLQVQPVGVLSTGALMEISFGLFMFFTFRKGNAVNTTSL